MAINESEIFRMARLANLEVDHANLSDTQNQLERILQLMQKLQAFDTTGVEPMAHPLEAFQDIRLRLCADTPLPTQTEAQRAANMANAPAVHAGLFLVPTIIE